MNSDQPETELQYPSRSGSRLSGSYFVVNKIAAYGIAQNWHKI